MSGLPQKRTSDLRFKEYAPYRLGRIWKVDTGKGEPDGGLIVLPDSMTTAHRNAIIELAAVHRLPATYPLRSFVKSGGLVSYGADLVASFRQATSYVDRILRGASPAGLPAQQSTKLELVMAGGRPLGRGLSI
jgi:putative ABC transport system substrate-binding protein